MKGDYEAVIGLEIHVQMSTRTKMFCSCPVEFGAPPNQNTCPVCTGMPGVLPVINARAVEYAVKAALALGAKVNLKSVMARKNYFYPDLPKGYQISQYELPLAEGGQVVIETENGEKVIRLVRLHIEEDAGKLIHDEKGESLVDLNRAGTPLMEIVTMPDLSSPQEASAFMREVRKIMRYLGISEGDMEKGHLRCDANVSVRRRGEAQLGTKTEVKNMNSFRFVEKALEYEIRRQVQILEEGGEVVQETRLFDPSTGTTRSMRSKEEAHDYRYFPDPDLIPLVLDKNWVDRIEENLPELPRAKKERYIKELNLPPYDAGVLTETKEIAEFFEKVVAEGVSPKKASNWVMVEVMRIIKEKELNIRHLALSPSSLAKLIRMVEEGKLTGNMAKDVLDVCASTGKDPEEVAQEKGYEVLSDEGELESVVRKIVDEHPDEVQKYLSGKDKIIGWFVGQVMRELKGKADPRKAGELVRRILNEKKGS